MSPDTPAPKTAAVIPRSSAMHYQGREELREAAG